MLIEIASLWNELCVTGFLLYVIAWVFVGFTFLATHTKHTIVGAILALITMFFSQISQIVIKIGVLLAVARVILNFI